jgi:hypothetical protein
MTDNPILKINLDELNIEQLNKLTALLFIGGFTKQAMKVEHYIKAQGL